MKKAIKMIAGACAAAVVCAGGLLYYNLSRQNVRHTSATFVMDAVADQKVYGPNGEKAIAAAEQAFREMENRLSVYKEGSDIARLNAAAGSGEAVAVEAQTYALLSQAKTLSAQAGGAFELTIAPLALAWGITTDAPRVLQQDEIDALLPLVDDRGLLLESGTARLQRPGQAVDLGGIAKGAACDVAKEVYDEYGIRAALCWLGGSRQAEPDRGRAATYPGHGNYGAPRYRSHRKRSADAEHCWTGLTERCPWSHAGYSGSCGHSKGRNWRRRWHRVAGRRS